MSVGSDVCDRKLTESILHLFMQALLALVYVLSPKLTILLSLAIETRFYAIFREAAYTRNRFDSCLPVTYDDMVNFCDLWQ